MSYLEKAKALFGIKPLNIGELNRRATLAVKQLGSPGPPEDPLDDIDITEEYEKVRGLLEAGSPIVFVDGAAGTGKTTLIRYIRTTLGLKRRTVVLAPTGVAALNVNGATVHSFFHLPPKIHEEEDIKRVFDRELYEKLELLIVDEVSMVRCDLMDSIDRFLRKNRSVDRPFGGVQLLLVGDLFQMPPVTPRHEWDVLRRKGYDNKFFFSAFSLQKLDMFPAKLTHVYRQNDQFFIELLNSLRSGNNVDSAIAELNQQCALTDDYDPDITLVCTNREADQINIDELQRLSAKEYSFKGEFFGDFSYQNDRLPSPFDLRVKVGARVMFTKNDAQRRWVNGTLGIVHEVNEEGIRVRLIGDSHEEVFDVQRAVWSKYTYKYDSTLNRITAQETGRYTQYPLMLAWAVTIHKSQGKTFLGIGLPTVTTRCSVPLLQRRLGRSH
jgi:ATP-dependent exoDNAse (exonuclease V) alpha subunit